MKLLSIALFTTLLCLCNSGDGMPGGDGEQGPPGQQGPAGPQGPPGMSVEHDGNRIKARYITTSDGYKMELGLWDAQRAESCYWVRLDNTLRCMPSFWTGYTGVGIGGEEITYLDDKCKTPIYIPAQAPDLNLCPYDGVTKYILISDGSTFPTFCAAPSWNANTIPEIPTKTSNFFSLGAVQVFGSPRPNLYCLSSTSMCQPCNPSRTFYYPLTKIEFTEFAEGTISNP